MATFLDTLSTIVHPVILTLISSVCLASADAFAKRSVATLSPRTFLTFRWIVSSIFTMVMIAAFGAWGTFQLEWSTVGLGVAAGLMGPVFAWSCFSRALQILDVSVATPIRSFSTIVAVILAATLLGERLHAGIVFGTVLVIVGVYFVQVAPRGAKQPVGRHPAHVRGLVLAFVAAAAWGVAVLAFKAASVAMPVLEVNWFRNTVPAIVFGLSVFYTLGRPAQPGEPSRTAQFRLSREGVIAALGASLIADTFGWTLQFAAFRTGDVVVLAPLQYVAPLWIALIAWLVMGEQVSRRRLAGIALSVVGAVAVTLPL